MEKLVTVQEHNKLNEVYVDKNDGGEQPRRYVVARHTDSKAQYFERIATIHFQLGARDEDWSKPGVLTQDLMEIAKHQLEYFQEGELANKETGMAISCLEEGLMWLDKRTSDRANREVLGTNKE